jgi:hypothetical protein
MKDVGHYIVRTVDQIAYDPPVGRNFCTESIIQATGRSHCVGRGAHPADALRNVLGVTRVAAFQDKLKTAEKGA